MKKALFTLMILCFAGLVMAQEANENEFKMTIGDTAARPKVFRKRPTLQFSSPPTPFTTRSCFIISRAFNLSVSTPSMDV